MKLLAFIALSILLWSSNSIGQILGCTDALAINFDSQATINDGSCLYSVDTLFIEDSLELPVGFNGTSGLLNWGDTILTHNDHNDSRIYVLSATNLAVFDTIDTQLYFKDWEEIAEDEDYFYLGDFGNNQSGNRTDLRIFRLKKAEDYTNPIIDTIRFTYENQTDLTATNPNATNFDCEAFVVSSDAIYLFSKEWVSKKTSIYKLPKVPGVYEAEFQETWNVQGLITGATLLEDKRLIVLSGYSNLLQPFIVLLYDYSDDQFFSGNKRKIHIDLPFHQIEGITTQNGIEYYLSNEYFSNSTLNIQVLAKLHKINLSSFLSHYLFENDDSEEDDEDLTAIQNENNEFLVYPNPTTSIITLKFNPTLIESLGLKSIFIINELGQLVYSVEILNNTGEIPLYINQSNGIYSLIIVDSSAQVVYKKRFTKL